ncbi:serine/threonine protein kinase [Kaistia defluvii]|uniref:HPr kinase/phosphorylase n=1 Tax=Kaistia defluvii TaxID=410841 RepID=UPI002252C863|nr:serine/threonine protein kinase [Kaistia defluvii]MCX5520606.1 serine/threonine protein kinase [Kaistia defluvii]
MAGTVHASAVWVDGAGVLIRGPSGCGKSSLLLALLMADRPASRLVADDRVHLAAVAGRLQASVPGILAGLLEIRGQGLVTVPYLSPVSIDLVVDLEPIERCARMPEEADRTAQIEGVAVRRLALPLGQADGWIRVRAALAFRSAIV